MIEGLQIAITKMLADPAPAPLGPPMPAAAPPPIMANQHLPAAAAAAVARASVPMMEARPADGGMIMQGLGAADGRRVMVLSCRRPSVLLWMSERADAERGGEPPRPCKCAQGKPAAASVSRRQGGGEDEVYYEHQATRRASEKTWQLARDNNGRCRADALPIGTVFRRGESAHDRRAAHL